MTKSYYVTRTAVLAGALALLAASTHVSAQSDSSLINKLVQKGILTQKEADQLIKESDSDFHKAYQSESHTPSWLKNVTFSGDVRVRMDDMWPETGLMNSSGYQVPNRLRFRLRARYGAVWQAADWATIGLRLGSGDERSSGGDASPNSNNQTFTHFFSKKPLFIDAAYFTIHPPRLDWLSVSAGKMNKLLWEPSLNSPMIYDPDLTPEGAVEQIHYKFGPHDNITAFGNVAEYVLDEQAFGIGGQGTGDSYLFDGQVGVSANLIGDAKAPKLKLTGAGGYLTTTGLHNVPRSDASGNHGNYDPVGSGATGVNAQNYYANFDVLYGRGQASWQISDKPILGTPCLLTLSGEYDKNLNDAYKAVGDQTAGWTGQIMFGKADKRGQWQIAYQYKYLQADAVLDSLADDDFGGTDRKGHVIKAAYNIFDWWQVGTTVFITEKISSRPNFVGGTETHNQQGIPGQNQIRLFVDTMFKF